MAEAAKAVSDHLDGRMAYVNVMNRLSVDCDCDSSPAEPDMADIGILASEDPVALDRACVDLVYAAPDGGSLVRRMESLNGPHILEHAEAVGLGSQEMCIRDRLMPMLPTTKPWRRFSASWPALPRASTVRCLSLIHI